MTDYKNFVWNSFERAVRDLVSCGYCCFDITFDYRTKTYIAEATDFIIKVKYTVSLKQVLPFINLVREIDPLQADLFSIDYLESLQNLL